MTVITHSVPASGSRFLSSLDAPGGGKGIKTEKPSTEEGISLDQMGRNQCPNWKGYVLRGTGPDGVIWSPKKCERWDCPAPSCGGLKRAAAAELFAGGVREAHKQGEEVRFITLTAPGRGMSLNGIYEGLKRIMGTLKKTGEVREYAGVVEFQERGAPHLHLLATGEYIDQTRLSKLARGRRGSKGRFGKMAWINTLTSSSSSEDAVRIDGYLTKDLWAFGQDMAELIPASRSEQLHKMRKSRKRLLPVRKSHGWYEGGLDAATDAVLRRWHPDSVPATEGVCEWQLFRMVPETGELRFVQSLSKAQAASELDPLTSD